MTEEPPMFDSPEWYDRSVNWEARFSREMPVLTDVFGPPSSGGILDAGCGPGRHACELARRSYRVTALDADAGMLELAAGHAGESGVEIETVQAPYSEMAERTDGGFDGVYCLANSLAAAKSQERCREAVHMFARALRPGGRLFVQMLNFQKMRREEPCIRGPRVTLHDGFEYVSVRHFTFDRDACQVTNVTLWNEPPWRYWSHTGLLYPIAVDEMNQWCAEAGLRSDAQYGSYARDPFDIDQSVDLITIATRATE
jgi:SAM-dependent methyltransferase